MSENADIATATEEEKESNGIISQIRDIRSSQRGESCYLNSHITIVISFKKLRTIVKYPGTLRSY